MVAQHSITSSSDAVHLHLRSSASDLDSLSNRFSIPIQHRSSQAFTISVGPKFSQIGIAMEIEMKFSVPEIQIRAI
jgi:hypothetical protein